MLGFFLKISDDCILPSLVSEWVVVVKKNAQVKKNRHTNNEAVSKMHSLWASIDNEYYNLRRSFLAINRSI